MKSLTSFLIFSSLLFLFSCSDNTQSSESLDILAKYDTQIDLRDGCPPANPTGGCTLDIDFVPRETECIMQIDAYVSSIDPICEEIQSWYVIIETNGSSTQFATVNNGLGSSGSSEWHSGDISIDCGEDVTIKIRALGTCCTNDYTIICSDYYQCTCV